MSEKKTRRPETRPVWVTALKRYERPSVRKAIFQLIDTVIPYLCMLVLMYLTIYWKAPYWVTLLLAIPTAGFLVRTFIIFHDCVHGSYLASQAAVRILGTILGIITFTPFAEWRHHHGVHHSTSGNLDRRGVGDVWTMTVAEYAASSRAKRLAYRLFRNPIFMFGLGPLYMFLVLHRIPSRKARKAEITDVIIADIVLAIVVVAAAFTIGIKAYILVQLPVLMLGGSAGIWLFYVQHQFDPSYWARTEDWGSMEAAMQGSSFYKLPKVLQWISGNIGFHHIHHLRPRIPNYNLERCLRENKELQLDNPLTLWRSLKSVRLNLWDEKRHILLSFRQAVRTIRRGPQTA